MKILLGLVFVFALATLGYGQETANQSGVIYEQNEVDVKARIIKTEHPKGRDCSDSVVRILLRVVLHSSGKVTDVEVLESSNCKQFQSEAIRMAQKIKFTPAKKDGVNVSQYKKIE